MRQKKISEKQSAELLAKREKIALEELRELGFRISLWEPREYIEPDPLRGIEGCWKTGTCYVQAESAMGKRKTISAQSAVGALDQARAWLKYQRERLAPDQRFVIVHGGAAVPVRHRIVGDAAETELRRQNTERRIVSLDGTPHLVDAHGDPLKGDTSRASQFA